MTILALLIIDVQKAIDHPKWGDRSNPAAEEKMAELLAVWRKKGLPVFHVKHSSVEETSPYRAGQPLHDFKPEVAPLNDEKIIYKSTNNAFVDTELKALLTEQSIEDIIVCGVLTQHSIDCTARMAASLGYKVTVVSDAVAATAVVDANGKLWSANDVQALTLAHLEADYGAVKTTDEIIKALR